MPETTAPNTVTPTGTPTGTPTPAPPRSFETSHTGIFHGTTIDYRCIAAEAHLSGTDGKPRASLFSFSYLAASETPTARPVLFIFNGGPGSASLWLHMGALGPRRVVVPGDGGLAGNAPYTVIDHPDCLLDTADLVFIDPPGTGYSQAIGDAKPDAFWGVASDAEIIGDFIRHWLTAHQRWASPRFLCGESYGTTRAVAVAGRLAGDLAGIAFTGIVLISAILDFHTARFEPGNPIADAAFLPTYAATALYHGRAAAPHGRDAFLTEARHFAAHHYLPALFAGSALDPATYASVRATLARLTGLSERWLDQTRLRIEPGRFRKELLRDQGVTVGRFDSRYRGTDFDDAGAMPDADPSSYGMDHAYVSAMHDHLTRTLAIDWTRTYRPFNMDVAKAWDWIGPKTEGAARWPGYTNVAPTLGRLLRESPSLRVMIANGYYDIATPFYAAESTVARNGIDASRVRMTYYEAGHMMYLHEASLSALMAGVRGFITP
jgi:carboxypeptidase C (cathepsin A)